jgi:hypothetical protein
MQGRWLATKRAPQYGAVALAMVLVVAGGFLSSPRGTGSASNGSVPTEGGSTAITTDLSPSAPASITYGPYVTTETADFWGVSVDGTESPDNRIVASLLNATPITTLRYGADWSDQENWTYSSTFNGCFYSAGATAPPNCTAIQNNVTAFSTLCKWISSDYCILGLPAEINNPSVATNMTHWLEQTDDWEPNCVAIGNEPSSWNNYDLPWSSWTSGHTRDPSATHLAETVSNYTDALRHISSSACLIGLEASTNYVAGSSEISDISSTVTNLSAYSFHLYPNSDCSGETVAQVLSLSHLTEIQTAYSDDFAPNAGGKPVSIHEFNLGINNCGSQIADYVGAVFDSATVAQALALGIPDLTYFHFYCGGSQCMYDSTGSGTPTPTYSLYSGLYTHFYADIIHNATVSTGNPTFAVVGYKAGPPHYTLYSVLVSNAASATSELVSMTGVLNSTCQTSMEAYYQTPGKGVWSYALPSNDTIDLPDQSTAVVDWECYSPPSPPPNATASSLAKPSLSDESFNSVSTSLGLSAVAAKAGIALENGAYTTVVSIGRDAGDGPGAGQPSPAVARWS